MIEAFRQALLLKHLHRAGWIRRDVPPDRCESVAAHSFGVALLAWWLIEEYDFDLDRDKVLRLALIHDLGEVHAGDITPLDGVSAEDKHAREESGLRKITATLAQGESLTDLWKEYATQASPEARFVREVDRLDMAFQAAHYESEEEIDLAEFFESAAQIIETPQLLALLKAVREA